MQKKIFFITVASFLLLSGCTSSVQRSRSTASDSAIPLSEDAIEHLEDRAMRPLKVVTDQNNHLRYVTVEVVQKQESVQQGLSERDQIGSDGMLFVFPTKGRPVFWMPKMKFDIDIVWVRNWKVVGIFPNVPKPESPDQDPATLPKYPAPQDVDMVLEIPAGTAKSWNLQVGDALELL